MTLRRPGFVLFTVALSAIAAIPAIGQEDLLVYAPKPGENAFSGLTVSVNTPSLAADPALLRVQLPGDEPRVVVRDGADLRGENDLAWRGRFEGTAASRVVLTLRGDLVVGRFFDGRRVILLEPGAAGHKIRHLDLSSLPPEGEPLVPDFEATAGAPVSQSVDPVDGIDVMSVYSPQARSGAGGTAQIEAVIQAAVDNANTAFIDSNMDARFVLVHMDETTRNEVGGSLSADLSWLASDAGVAALRNSVAADMVSLIVNSGSYCGRGYVMRSPGPGFESSAFQVTLRSCAVGNLSYAHEHGHNMGFEHDPDNGPGSSTASYPWSFGHRYSGNYRTVMAYNCSPSCTRVAHFSNPDIDHAGLPSGIDGERDNARSGDLTAPIVTDFRLRNSSAPDLVVLSPAVSNTSPEENESFTTSATVTNQGDAIADATTLRYYRSTNSTISTFDTQLSTDSVGSLSGGASSPQSDLHSIDTAGTWWLGACVDSVAGESSNNNNCSSGIQVTVSVPTGCSAPDVLYLDNSTVNTTTTWEACTAIYAGPNWTVEVSGNATLRAGQKVVLRNGVVVAGILSIEVAEPQ